MPLGFFTGVNLKTKPLIFALLSAAAAAMLPCLASAEEPGQKDLSILAFLEPGTGAAIPFSAARPAPICQDGAEGYFVPPIPGKTYLETEEIPVETFHDRFRVGFDSGILYPLIAQKAAYNVGWWARLYGQISLDFGPDFVRTAAELGIGMGQSQSSRSDQQYRITSNYTFITVRGLVDFLPASPSDLELFAGIGIGFEFASGFVQRSTSTLVWVEEANSTNFNPLVEFGGLYGFELTPMMYLTLKAAFIHPLGSRNIMLFSEIEIGIQFLFS